MDSRADYNNNPGNLRPPPKITYQGQIGIDDKGFAIFDSPENGERALRNDIRIKIERGINTPEKFIDMYAPAGKDKYGDENSEEGRENYKIWLANRLGLKSTNDPFPENAVDILSGAIRDFEGGTWNKPKPEPDKKAEGASDDGTTLASGDATDQSRITPSSSSEVPGYSEKTAQAMGVLGATLGAGVAAPIETAKQVYPLLPNIINAVSPGREISPTQAQSRMSLQRYLSSQIPDTMRLSLTELEKISGSGKIRTMSEVQNALRAIQKIDSQRVAKTTSIDPKTGVPRKIYTSVPGRTPVDLTPYEVKPSGPLGRAVGRSLTTAGEITRAAAPSVGRIGFGALSGAGAMMSGYEAAELARKIESDRAKKINQEPVFMGKTADELRLMSKMAATAGGGLGMVPTLPTQLGAFLLSAPELAFSAYDWYKNRGKEEGLPAASPASPGALPADGRLVPQ